MGMGDGQGTLWGRARGAKSNEKNMQDGWPGLELLVQRNIHLQAEVVRRSTRGEALLPSSLHLGEPLVDRRATWMTLLVSSAFS